MKKSKIVWLFVLSIIGTVVGYVLTNSVKFNLCIQTQYDCRSLFNKIGDPLLYGMGALAIIFLILIFIPTAINAWKKFAKWYIPVATLIFIFYPNPSSGDLFSPYPEQIFQWLSALYVIISIVIILISKIHRSNPPMVIK
jgi:hypothetical protein